MTVSYEIDAGGIAHARMDDGKANVLNDASCSGLREAIARAGDDGAGALVLWGREGMFSGGIDLAVIRSDDPSARFASLSGIAHTLLAMWTAPLPTVAAITGHAIAGGAILSLACDRRIVARGTAKLGVNETQLGMVLPTWAVAIVESAVRSECRQDVMLEGRLFDADGAARVGLVHQVVDDGSALAGAVGTVAAELAALPTHSYAGNKAMLRSAAAEHAAARVAAEMGGGFASDA